MLILISTAGKARSSKSGTHTHRHQPPAPNAGQSTHDVKCYDVLTNGAAKTSNRECHRSDQEAYFSTKDVGEPSIQGLRSRAGEQIRSCDPRSYVGSVELGTDGRIRSRCDSTVEPPKEDIGEDSLHLSMPLHIMVLRNTSLPICIQMKTVKDVSLLVLAMGCSEPIRGVSSSTCLSAADDTRSVDIWTVT